MRLSKNTYFKILGIEPTISVAIIKKAYRKKALQYHPDRNSSPGAHEKFILLTEAYEFLINAPKSNVDDQQYSQKTPEEVLAARMQKARKRYKEALKKEVQDDKVYFEKITKGLRGGMFRVYAWLALLVALVWFLDYHVLESNVVYLDEEPVYSQGGQVCYFIKGREYCFGKDELHNFEGDLMAKAYFSPIYKDLKYVKRLDTLEEGRRVVPFGGFASVYPYVIVFLLLPFFTFYFRKPTVVFTMLYLFCVSIVSFVMLFRLFSLFL